MNRRQAIQAIVISPPALSRIWASEGMRTFQMSISSQGRFVPQFQNGFLTFRDMDRVTVSVVDATGNLVMTRKISIPDAVVTGVSAVAVSPLKKVVMSASAKDADGRFASVLILTDLTGSGTTVVRTTPYAATVVAFLPDGRLLCVGREYDDQFNSVPGYSIVRFYSNGGILLGKALNITQTNLGRQDVKPLNWQPVFGADRIGLFDHFTSQRYMEIDHNGAMIRPPGPLGSGVDKNVSGIALLSTGDRLVSGGPGLLDIFRLKGANSSITKELINSLPLPNDVTGLKVLGTLNSDLALMAFPGERLVFVPQPVT
jgi:hypothetical protein